MLKHNFIIALRSIKKYWKYSIMNIFGLAIGLASVIFIAIYIDDELKYDRFHEKGDRIYRVNRLYNTNAVNEDAATLEFPGGPAIQADYPDLVEKVVRFFNFMRPEMFVEYRKNDNESVRFNETGFFLVDSTVFDVFTFPFVEGNPKTALNCPNNIVITQSTAKKYFGDENPIGKVLRLEELLDFKVTGIIKDIPSQTHFRISLLGSLSTCRQLYGGQLPTTWIWNPCWTYVLLKKGINPELLDKKFPQFYKNHYNDLKDQDVKLYLQPLRKIHLNSHHVYEMFPNSNINYVYILSIIAIIVLLLASANFMNLTTASSAARAKEIAVKKIIGGWRTQLAVQFICEAVVQSLFAIAVSLVAIELLLPSYNRFIEKDISPSFVFESTSLLIFTGFAIIVGAFAGIYPAFFLSSFKPLTVLRGALKNGTNTGAIRKILVVVQFTISISLIIGTWVVYSQLKFLRNAELGFSKDHIITFQSSGSLLGKYNAFKHELLKNKNIKYVTGSEDVLGVNHNTRAYQVEGLNPGQYYWIPAFMVDWDFVETYGIKVVAGRSFSSDFPSDTFKAVMINETMVRDFGWTNENAIGKRVKSTDGDERVIGVFRDINAMSLHRPVTKFILDMFIRPEAFANIISIKVSTDNYKEVLDYVNSIWNKFVPSRPFEYKFLDNQLEALYRDEAKFGGFSLMLTIIALIIANMGLGGLTSFLAAQRTKEIGIRRVLGASTRNIVGLMFSNYVILLLISILLSWPITYLIISNWLANYFRHISASWWIFISSALISLLIPIIIIGYRAIKTSLLNPAATLRYE